MIDMEEDNVYPLVILLTLKEHKSGVWITRLVEAFASVSKCCQVEVISLESLLSNADPTSLFSSPLPSLIINRVSDAASPQLQKACCGLLQLAATVYGLKVWNGPASYTLCCNKWCHHALFAKVQLQSPSTQMLLNATTNTLEAAITELSKGQQEVPTLLLKPNAGGFGAGIQKIDLSGKSNISSDPNILYETASNYADGMTLVQEFIETDSIFRIWFLCGKVQCGIVRHNHDGNYEFTSACMASICTRKQPATIRAYSIPNDVRFELEQQLLPLLSDAHSGSVEFLCDKQGKRLYFDLNLLSTLPLVEQVEDADAVWGTDYDPWNEMASAMLDYAGC